MVLQKLEAAKDELRKTLKRRREISIQLNDTQYIEFDTKGILDSGKTGNNNEAMIKLREKSSALVKEVKDRKIN